MRRCASLCLCMCLPLATAFAAQPAGALPADVSRMLEQAGIRVPGIGVYITEPGSARPVVEVAADQPFTPASTLKLVTSIAALELLGPQFRWSTPVLMTGRIDKGVLEGDLIVRGGNDPSLTWARIDELVKRLRKRGINTIQGNIVADRGLYMAPESETRAYAAEAALPLNSPPDSLVVNSKTVTLRFVPDARTRSVVVRVEPPLDGVHLRGTVAYAAGPCAGQQPFVDADGDLDYARIRVDGTLPQGCGTRTVVVSVLGHREFFQRAFAQLWKTAGGEWRGRFEEHTDAHKRAVVIDRITSPTLAEVIKEINKTSNNLMARQLFLQIALSDGALSTKAPLATRAFERVRRMFREKGLELPDLVMENGAGTSQAERISPRSLARILTFALAQPYANTLIDSLAVAGVDGTMHARLGHSPVAGKAYLKTGSLPEVRSLAGYVRDANGKLYVAAILVNHRNAGASLAAIDATVDWLHRRAEHALITVENARVTRPSPTAQVDVFPRKAEYALQLDAMKERNTAVIPQELRRESGDLARPPER